jgi:uncharacterized membrane protein YtjA (UPF0391 family)
MRRQALIFILVAIVAGVLGFGGRVGLAAEVAKLTFFVFGILFVLSSIFDRAPPAPSN